MRQIVQLRFARALRRCYALVSLVLFSSLVAAAPAMGQQGYGKGQRDDRLRPCDELMDHGRRGEARRCYRQLITSVADPAVRAEAFWGLGDFKQSNELFRAAVEANPQDPDLRVRWGYLFLETHQRSEAIQLFKEALEIDEDHLPAKLGQAGVLAQRFEGKALELAEEVIETDPNLLEGHLLLAQMAIEEKDLDKADQQLDVALEKVAEQDLSPLEIYSMKAAIDLLRGKSESEWTEKALEYNPTYGKIHADSAHFYVITRRYREAAKLYRKAIELDPELWSAHADLAVNLLRLGKDAEGRRELEIAYSGDPYNPKTVNTLRLLDSFDNFQDHSNKDGVTLGSEEELRASVHKPTIILRLHMEEDEVLRPYVMDLAERSVANFAEKYDFRPKQPIRIEMYPDHDDFAVRTMGMPGLGLLGVTFGYVVAMDSPSARRPGSFHWGTTLWHELAHVFTLEATEHLVPRWFSEGISMYEEWEADPRWGERISPDFVKAVQDDKLLPIAELDKGFVRPRYPSQVAVSYFQAGLVCRMIAEQWGFSRLVEMLRGFGKELSTEQNIQRVLELSTEEFDDRFAAYIESQMGELVESFERWREKLKEALQAAREKKWSDVIEPARQARDLYPDYVESGSPYRLLANAHEELGNRAFAVEQLQEYVGQGGRDPETIQRLAGWLDEMGRRAEAVKALESLLYIAPGDPELHRTLGDWFFEQDRLKEAAREYQTVLATKPLDLAGTHFDLARTYHKMKDQKQTRKHLLLALEAAPSYRPAQQLLLKIVN